MHGELSGCYDRSVSDRNQLPDLTYEEISPWRGKGKGGGEFRGRNDGRGLRDRKGTNRNGECKLDLFMLFESSI